MQHSKSRPASRSTSLTLAVLGNAAATKTQTGCCANTSPSAVDEDNIRKVIHCGILLIFVVETAGLSEELAGRDCHLGSVRGRCQ